MSAEVFVDASLFLGMHARDTATRAACRAFMASRFRSGVVMAWEQVGRCDDVVWAHPRAVQDAYYPFMDVLHSTMTVERRPLSTDDVRLAVADERLCGLPTHEALAVAMAANAGGRLVTVSPRLRDRTDLPVEGPCGPPDARFPEDLEELYDRSLVLVVDTEAL